MRVISPLVSTATSGDKQIPLSWAIPAAYGGGDTTMIRYKAPTDPDWTEITTPAGATSYTIPALTNGTTYNIEARGAASTACPWAKTTATPRQPGTPGTPACVKPTLTVTPKDAALTAAWAHGTATSFRIRHKKTADTTYGASTTTTGNTHTISGLTNGTTYTIAVFAHATHCDPNNPNHWTQQDDTPTALAPPPKHSGPTTSTHPHRIRLHHNNNLDRTQRWW